MEELNPYAPPQSQVLPDNTDAVRERLEFLRIEGHLKALGVLTMILSLMLATSKVMTFRILAREFGMTVVPWPYIALYSLSFAVGLGLYFLKRWAGGMMIVFAVLLIVTNLFQLPGSVIGIIIQSFVLRFLLHAGARRVLSREYQGMIQRTPMIVSPAAAWIYPVVALLVLLVAVIFMWR